MEKGTYGLAVNARPVLALQSVMSLFRRSFSFASFLFSKRALALAVQASWSKDWAVSE
jgi:hypothetical protein